MFRHDLTFKMALLNVRSISNKTFLINDFFSSHDMDLLFITETWLNCNELGPLAEAAPDDCNFDSSPRT